MPAAFLFLLSALVGAMMPVQAAANARLSALAGSPIWAAAISLGIATACVGLSVIGARAAPPSWAMLREVPAWAWAGGLIGAAIVFAGLMLLPRIGASAFVTALIAGQLASGVLIDRYGLFGIAAQPINGWRIVAILCIVLGALAMAAGADRA